MIWPIGKNLIRPTVKKVDSVPWLCCETITNGLVRHLETGRPSAYTGVVPGYTIESSDRSDDFDFQKSETRKRRSGAYRSLFHNEGSL